VRGDGEGIWKGIEKRVFCDSASVTGVDCDSEKLDRLCDSCRSECIFCRGRDFCQSGDEGLTMGTDISLLLSRVSIVSRLESSLLQVLVSPIVSNDTP